MPIEVISYDPTIHNTYPSRPIQAFIKTTHNNHKSLDRDIKIRVEVVGVKDLQDYDLPPLVITVPSMEEWRSVNGRRLPLVMTDWEERLPV